MNDQNDNALPPGCEFDGYRIARVLGTGGFGITYLAEEVETGRRVAIKEYLPKGTAQRRPGEAAIRVAGATERAAFDLGLARFREEARTLIRFDHPNIVRSLRFVAAHGTAYLVMAYVEGESLESVLARAGKLPESEVEEIAFPLLSGLAAVHRAGFLHRDVKPANIFLRRDNGAPVLLDFGAARQAFGQGAKTLTAIYSHGYAPFEQYSESQGAQGPWTDIYALGATLYRCIAGNKPVAAPDRVMALVAARPDPLPPAAQLGRGLYSTGLLAAIDAALRIREADRPQSIEAFEAILRGPAERATPAPVAPVAAAAIADETLMAPGPPPAAEPIQPPPTLRPPPAPPIAAPLRPVARRPVWPWALVNILLLTALAALGRHAMDRADVDARWAAWNAIREIKDCPACPLLVVLPAGEFAMGSPESERPLIGNELPQRTVRIARPFALGRGEVTNEEFDACVADGGCRRRGFASDAAQAPFPAAQVSFNDTQDYVRWLSRKTGKAYRLPSEAEWEYAARGGAATRYAWGERMFPEYAHCRDCRANGEPDGPLRAGALRWNGFTLYHMAGNLAEWVADCWNHDHTGAPSDGTARGGDCALRVVRGGSWASPMRDVRPAARSALNVERRDGRTGFRVARAVE